MTSGTSIAETSIVEGEASLMVRAGPSIFEEALTFKAEGEGLVTVTD